MYEIPQGYGEIQANLPLLKFITQYVVCVTSENQAVPASAAVCLVHTGALFGGWRCNDERTRTHDVLVWFRLAISVRGC
jgi:hypothetical protein